MLLHRLKHPRHGKAKLSEFVPSAASKSYRVKEVQQTELQAPFLRGREDSDANGSASHVSINSAACFSKPKDDDDVLDWMGKCKQASK